MDRNEEMQKTISTQELKNSIGEVLDGVRLRGDRYIVERRGQALAALVPIRVHENYEKRRERLFEMIEAIHMRNKDVPSEEIQEAIDRAIREVRAEKRKASQK
jgi:antitoxin (DNA-binding transcriptional repressor) of toxin-antitoxin stability system